MNLKTVSKFIIMGIKHPLMFIAFIIHWALVLQIVQKEFQEQTALENMIFKR